MDTLNVTRFYPFDDSMLGVSEGAFSLNVPAHEQVSNSYLTNEMFKLKLRIDQ